MIGVHTAAAAEAIGLATKAGLAPRDVFDIIKNAAGSSFSFKDCVPQMLNEDWVPRSSLDAAVENMVCHSLMWEKSALTAHREP